MGKVHENPTLLGIHGTMHLGVIRGRGRKKKWTSSILVSPTVRLSSSPFPGKLCQQATECVYEERRKQNAKRQQCEIKTFRGNRLLALHLRVSPQSMHHRGDGELRGLRKTDYFIFYVVKKKIV
jgi:hypothetical protein